MVEVQKNSLFLREHANISGCRIALPAEPEAVLLGSAILAATAAGAFPNLTAGMSSMSRAGAVILPERGEVASFHDRKHKVFLQMYEDQIRYRSLMDT